MKRNVRVVTILCAGMMGVGVLTGCSQANGNVPVNGSVSNVVSTGGEVNATSKTGTQNEIVQLQSIKQIVSDISTMQNDIVKAAEMYTEQSGSGNAVQMAQDFNSQMTQVNSAVSAEKVKFNDAFSKSQLVNFNDEGVVTFDINNLFQDIQNANQALSSGIVTNSADMMKIGLDDQQTVINDINQINGKIDDALSKLGAN